MNNTSPPLRIAYLTGTYPRATDTFIRIEVEQLRRLGFDVATFSVRRPPADHMVSEELRRESDQTVYLLAAGMVRLVWSTIVTAVRSPRKMFAMVCLMARTGTPGISGRLRQVAYLFEAALLAQQLKRRGVCHLHNHLGANSAHVAMLASGLSGIPYSLTIHGPHIFFAIHQWALGEKIARAAFTACIGNFCRSQCMVVAPPEAWDRLKIVRCCVYPEFLERAPAPVPAEPRLLCVGRLSAEKGQLVMIEAARRLAEENLDFEITMIGDGELRASLERMISRYGLGQHVRLVGWQKSPQVREHLSRSRALVVPSFAEGLPVVIMEALAMGRPVISTCIADISELVESGHNGWLIRPGSVAALTDAMRQVLKSSPDQLAAMGRAGAERVAKQHNATNEVGRLATLIRNAVEGVTASDVA